MKKSRLLGMASIRSLSSILLFLSCAVNASSFNFYLDAPISSYIVQDVDLFVGVGTIYNHYVAIDANESGPYQIDDQLFVPIGFSGDLVVNYFVNYRNDLDMDVLLKQTRPNGFSHTVGETQLSYPLPDYPEQGTFTYSWAQVKNYDFILSQGESTTIPFFTFTLIDTYGPTLPAITTDWGYETPAHDLSVGDGSVFYWQLIGESISAVPIPPVLWLFGSGLLGLIGLARHKKSAQQEELIKLNFTYKDRQNGTRRLGISLE